MNLKLKIILFRTEEGRFVFRPFGYNKFLLAIFGGILGGWFIAALGFVIGCILDCAYLKNEQKQHKKIDWRLNFLMLGAFIIQVTGINAAASYEEIRSRLNQAFGEAYVQNRLLFFNELLRQRIQVEAICDQLKARASTEDKISLIRFLYDLSSAAKNDVVKLNRTIFYLATRIQLDESYVRAISSEYANTSYQFTPGQQSRPNNEFSVFGIVDDATYADLKKAYHRLAKQYHPDSNLDLNDGDRKKSEDQFKKITEAYEKIKERKGWK